MTAPKRDLTNTVILVTGAAGGIGGGIVRLALEAGARLAVADVREQDLLDLQGEWGPDRVCVFAGDLSREDNATAFVQSAIEAFGRVDSVVANAAVGFYGGILDQSSEQVELMVDLNVKGTIWLTRAAVRAFREHGDGGDIVIIGSVAGLMMGGGKEAVYSATKGAQNNLGSALDRELRGEGIRVTTIAPAGVNTAFAAADGRFGGADPSEGPFMDPLDIAGAALYTLGQPRRMRTDLWTMWSLAEQR